VWQRFTTVNIRTIRLVVGVTYLMSFAAVATAQDPVATLPDSYRVQFENEHVRVVRVRYPAGAALPEHTHPSGTTLYVYLNDSDGITFRHSGGMNHVVNRPAVKAGSMRLSTGPEEHHTAENTSAAATDFLRIQLKTLKTPRPRGRLAAGTFPGENAISVEFTSEALVIQRFFIAPGQSIAATAVESVAPALWISVPSGDTRWAAAVAEERIVNEGSTSMELLRVILR
jgi:hypothetical protein